jgi:tetratricopeptide (TPR) repeat protein
LYPTADSLTLIHEVRVSTGLFSPVTTFLSIAGIFGVLVFALGLSARFPLLCFSILFFLVNHMVESTIIPLELIYEHRNYVPSFFFFMPIAAFLGRVLDYFSYRRSLQAAIAMLVVLIWTAQGHTVYMRNKLFADPVALWADNVQKAPGLSRVHTNLGNAFFEAGDLEKAYESYILAQKADYFHNPENQGVLYYNLGRYYFHSDRDFKKALQYLDQGRRLYPGNWRVWYYSALCQAGLGRYERARELSALACTRWPENEMLQYVRGLCLLKSGNYDACIHAARDALAKGLSRGKFYKLMGVAYLYMDQYDAAARILEMALDRMPDDEEIMLGLIHAYNKIGDTASGSRITGELFCKKGNKNWEQYLKDGSEENKLNAYKIDATKMMSVLQKYFLKLSPAK